MIDTPIERNALSAAQKPAAIPLAVLVEALNALQQVCELPYTPAISGALHTQLCYARTMLMLSLMPALAQRVEVAPC